MNNEAIEVSVVIPCLNESETLKACIQKAYQAFEKNKILGEVIVADNGSADSSPEIAKNLGAEIITVSEKGYGAALMGGIQQAQGKYIIMGDADDSYDFSAIYPFVEKLREGFDLVMGCRLPRGGGKIMPRAMPWLHRWIGNPVLTYIGRLFFKSPVRDFHCGMRAFNKRIFERLDLRSLGMEFASEMVVKATLGNLKITEIPITLHKDGRSGHPHLRSFRDGWRHLRFMLLFSPTWLFLIPGFLLFALGVIASSFLLFGPIRIGSVYLDTNTLLIANMIILVGFNLVTFAVFAKTFATQEGFLPSDKYFDKMFQHFNLEKGILFGVFVLLFGIIHLIRGVLFWKGNNFGYISYPISLRLVIPGVSAFILGFEIIFASFFMSLLGLKRRGPKL